MAAIGRHTGISGNPVLAVADPDAFTKGAVAVKCPGKYRLAADPNL